MAQTLYGILALVLVSMLSLNMQRGSMQTQQRQALNEVGMQITGVAEEVFDHIGREAVAFDRFVDSTRAIAPVCGRTETPKAFTEPARFATVACSGAGYESCPYIEGFHGMTDLSFERDGLPFEVDVEVAYVNPRTLAPLAPTARSFAKEVTLSVSSPLLYLNTPSNPLTVRLSRVYEYDAVTDPVYFPMKPDGSCPAV
jgi:hypothetical protein